VYGFADRCIFNSIQKMQECPTGSTRRLEVSQGHFDGNALESLVARPQPGVAVQGRSGEEVHVDVPDATAHQPMALEEIQDLFVGGCSEPRQRS
jgi:hypothetical protein